MLGLLVEVRLWLFTLNGGVQAVNICLCVEALGILHCVVSLQRRENTSHTLNLTRGTHSEFDLPARPVSPTVSLEAEGHGKMRLGCCSTSE